ncbi:hypothetical protein ACKLNO_00340 [Neisseriaceae bacterium B1]
MKQFTLIATCIATLSLAPCGSASSNSTSSSSSESKASSQTVSDSGKCKQLSDNGGNGKYRTMR